MSLPRVAVPLATAAATAALLVGGGAVAASAATPKLPVVSIADMDAIALPAHGTVQPYITLSTGRKVQAEDLVLTVDARGLAKVAKVAFSSDCTAKGLVATCSEPIYGRSSGRLGISPPLTLSALPHARLGAKGSYRITGHSAHVRFTGRSATVEVGGPALVLSGQAGHSGLKVGSTVSEPVRIRNAGNRPARAVAVVLWNTIGVDFAKRYANCKYGTYHAGVRQSVCYPTGSVGVGETAALSAAVRLKVGTRALTDYLDVEVLPAGSPDVPVLAKGSYHWGKGSRLSLKVVHPGHRTSAPYGSVSLPVKGGYTITGLRTRNTADFAVTGAKATAAKGRTAVFRFSLRNNGPAAVYDRSGGEGTPYALVHLPAGTTVVRHSANCHPYHYGQDAHGPYVCWPPGNYVARGSVSAFSITVRVDRVVKGAKGSVRLQVGPILGTVPGYDHNRRNNTAALVLN